MTTPAGPNLQPPPTIPPPKCPYCDAQMPGIQLYSWIAAPWLIIGAYCQACRALLHTQIVPVAVAEQQTQAPAGNPPGPRLFKPS
jgi:hypothetical protein